MRKLTVKNFSVIKEAELEFGKITVLIGPQSSGKSLICKLAYFFEQRVSELVLDGVRKAASLYETEKQIIESFLSYFPEDNIEQTIFQIQYQMGSSFSISVGMSDAFPSPYLEWKDKDFIRHFNNWQSNDPKRPPSHNSDRRREFMSGTDTGPMPIESDSVYIPTGRAFFSTPNKGFAALSTKNLDWITDRFATEFDADYRDLRESYQTKHLVLREVGNHSMEILKGRVVKEDGELLFESVENGKKRKRAFQILSSGTLELLPILNILAQVAKNTGFPIQPNMPSPPIGMVFAEEPELGVFPETQYQFAKLIASLVNSQSLWKSFCITTHSPYIMTAFNTLIEAGRVGGVPGNREKVSSVIPEKYWIKEGDFKAYAIKNGKLISIFKSEAEYPEGEGMIDGDYLDGVSDQLGKEFDRLLDIEFAK